MAPKPVGEKKRMSIFEAMQSSMATAVGLGGDDDEVVVLEAILFKKGSGTGMGAAMFGKSSSFKKRKFELVKHCRDGEGADVGPVLRYFDAAGKQFKGAILLGLIRFFKLWLRTAKERKYTEVQTDVYALS